MAKLRTLPTRAFGAEPSPPDVAGLAGWIAENRGREADIITYLLEASLLPQLSAGIGVPCAGGIFYHDRIRQAVSGAGEAGHAGDIHADTSAVREDATGIVLRRKGSWCAIPAPHTLGIRSRLQDEEERTEAITGVYRAIMREMRDTGIAGTVLLCDRMNGAELAALARQKVFFYASSPNRKDLETLLEFQTTVAVPGDRLGLLFDLMNEYEVSRIVLSDPDSAAIRSVLERVDPDQVTVGGYCTGTCEEYWKGLVASAVYFS